MEHLNKPPGNQPLSNLRVDLEVFGRMLSYLFLPRTSPSCPSSSSLFIPVGSFTLDRYEREKPAVPSSLLPWLVAFLRSLSLPSFQAWRSLSCCARCVPSCSVAVLAVLPRVSHPAFSSCLSSALILNAVAVSGEFPCFIISI